MIHPSKYMNIQVFYKTNQWTLTITRSFEFHHQAEHFRAVIFLTALDLEEHLLIILYASFIDTSINPQQNEWEFV